MLAAMAKSLLPVPPRWCVTTRPWDQAEAEQTIDDYEGAADDSIDGGE